MIVSVIEIFTEYLSIIMCMHKITKKKVTLDRYVWMFFLLDLFSVLLAHKYREEHSWLMMIVYVNFFVYVKMRLSERWVDAIKVFGAMLFLIPSLQMIVYFSIKLVLNLFSIEQIKGIAVNCIVCLLIKWWKKDYLLYLAKKLMKSSGLTVIFVLGTILIYFLHLYKQSEFVYNSLTVQTLVGIIGIGIITILWIDSENEKKIKAKELQLYELYSKTFEEAITVIRTRQHEFDNHINAIRCLQFTIDNPQELIQRQNEYCDKILSENSFNKVLKLHMDPILVGFLYSKFMYAKEQGISIVQEVHSIEFKNIIEVNEIIEILGILLDNAVEALSDEKFNQRVLIVRMIQENQREMSIEIANKSHKYLNSEIEKFCISGYSTKGKNRGLGLAEVKNIVKKYRADFHIGNIVYNGDNYLSFKIIFKK